MDIEALKNLLSDFDLANFLPDMTTISGWIVTLLRVAVMAGPLVILVLGLLYFLAPPKEANYSFGFRCYFGMGSVNAWRFTQRLAGIVLAPLGLILTIIMALICNGYKNMALDAAVFSAAKCVLWEIGLIAVACLAINIVVTILFNRHGDLRRPVEKKSPKKK